MERNCTKFVVHNSFDFEVRLSESLLACALGGCRPRRRTPGACNLCFVVSCLCDAFVGPLARPFAGTLVLAVFAARL
jgi:hypothetical protein